MTENDDALVFVIFVFHKNKNKTNKSHLQCTGVLYINYLHVMKVRYKKITLVIADNNCRYCAGLCARLG